nr:I78 family peptidase inhibitor [Serratia surfactantfaciens]
MLLTALLALSACSSSPEQGAAQMADADDTCGASQYQNYVGKPMTSLEGVRIESKVRAIPYNSAVTMDFNLRRLNFLGDSNDKIIRVYCG